jgi:acyl-CoA synthetase (AMP-forming)/AMP-acid ligase II
MLDLTQYQSIGAALKDALDKFASEVCLIEADREKEKERLTYRDFKERAHPLARAMQDSGFAAANHDQSVQMADFRLFRISLRRRSRSA